MSDTEGMTRETWHPGDFDDNICACTDGLHDLKDWVAVTYGPEKARRDAIIAAHNREPTADLCMCGDYRRQHVDGIGRCLVCDPKRQLPPACQQFRPTAADAPEICPHCGGVDGHYDDCKWPVNTQPTAADHNAVRELREALEEAVEFQAALNYARHGTDELVRDGSIPLWFVHAEAALAHSQGAGAEEGAK